ncbi:uncharacterized protein LOC141602019 [Silene latifolia]|uniref:uncharacterized protein LOC141602019 n=1 Tax=Silene latifolia TaxID=37657 RepID=UPI003D76C5CB
MASGYDWLQGAQVRVNLFHLIWNRVNLPKHSFIGWLMIQGRLYTKDMMLRFGVVSDGLCELCRTQLEDHQHLFFLCDFSIRCWTLLRDWIGVDLPTTDILNWCVNWRCKSLLKKHMVYAAVVAMIYHIWMARNICREENIVIAPWYIVIEIKSHIQNVHRSREWSTRYKHIVS